MPTTLLIDNGSRRAASTLNLRQLAARLSQRLATPVAPVSLLHADAVALEALDAQAAELLEPGLRARLHAGERDFLLLPLFFGPSGALSNWIPQLLTRLAAEYGAFRLALAPPLCPLPPGEPRLVEILSDNLHQLAAQFSDLREARLVLVDHGSPLPEVSAVRHWLAEQLRARLGGDTLLHEAVMERRASAEYDFNGPLLEEQLTALASADAQRPILISMLFLSPGRHAGSDGDISAICARVRDAYPALQIATTPLVGTHPLLIEILASRFAARERHQLILDHA